MPEAEDGSPVCRICYGGREVGRLISPCPCSGTLRFVHLECLNSWRLASANPRSSYQCDQCLYRYSFQRALYANILRSAVVLHALTLLAFVLAVLLCSGVAVLFDHGFISSSAGLEGAVSDDFLAQLANETESEVDDVREQLAAIGSFSWHGIHLVHFASGLVMVGASGLISMGVVWFPFLGARGAHRLEGPFILVTLLVGAVRVMFMLYAAFKDISGRALQSAESMILEVGEAIDASHPPPAPAAPAAMPAAPAGPPAIAGDKHEMTAKFAVSELKVASPLLPSPPSPIAMPRRDEAEAAENADDAYHAPAPEEEVAASVPADHSEAACELEAGAGVPLAQPPSEAPHLEGKQHHSYSADAVAAGDASIPLLPTGCCAAESAAEDQSFAC